MKITQLLSMLVFTCALFSAPDLRAQLYVKSNGYVGIGTLTPPSPLYVMGTAHFRYGNNILGLHPKPSGTAIGSNRDVVAFYWTQWKYNKIHAEQFVKRSDSSCKENIQPMTDGLDKIMQITPKSYNLCLYEDSTGRKEFGFIAQEIESIIPEIVVEGDSCKLMDYDQIIPFLVSAVQQQQAMIDSLDSVIVDLQFQKKREGSSRELDPGGANTSYLAQNSPNPFRESTYVRYRVTEDATTASIMVFNLQGTLLETYPIQQTGVGEVVIQGKSFRPGMYIYALVVDGREIDSKKMILSK